ncbi:AMP-dependent synthetase/ligase [Williamwhitmania taraxaci]|uniref:Long-chain acyl-CoA synthetase n=1 Tax=Williamwhitmania taraxaci TaxID=1640674 RepID=A0A1G6MPM2_9BACT|nr:long-chain fatty acid--CoA ligase [Williamwhitmania taraxaci]SDC56936.1 long-chain acyl-CoA synthetase [Williamwhitmania taraxaci]
MINKQTSGLFRHNVEKFGSKNAAYFRSENGTWIGISWTRFGEMVSHTASALLNIGITEGDRIGIISSNMPEWTVADLAIQSVRAISVPLFATTSAEQTFFMFNQTEVTIIFVGEQDEYNKAVALAPRLPFLKKIVAFDSQVILAEDNLSIYFSDLMDSGRVNPMENELNQRLRESTDEDIYTIIYTSGTSGEPKGVMLNNASMNHFIKNHHERLPMSESDTSICFLPLSHIFERGWSMICLAEGIAIYYLRNPKQIIEIIREVKPTLMCAVPRFFEKTYAGVLNAIENASPLKKAIFHWAIRTGAKRIEYTRREQQVPWVLAVKYWFADRLVLQTGRSVLGGKIRFMPCAGAALSDDIVQFFHSVGVNIKYGYGLTETSATVSCFTDTNFIIGSAGRVMPGVEVKIGDNDEILVKSATVTTGYYKRPDATAEAFVDGWFRTGDAGWLDAENNLYMKDRIKDLMKTSSGKYIAPQMIETLVGAHPAIDNISIIGDKQKYVTALIVPSFDHLKSWIQHHEIVFTSRHELVAHPAVVKYIQQIVEAAQINLSPYEQIKRFKLLTEEFTIQTGELTSTLKTRRAFVAEKFKAEIEEMYKG